MFKVDKNIIKIKNLGQIYTPGFIVKNILDLAGYKKEILNKHIIDNSCGNGAFLVEIVDRYCKAFIKKYGNKKNNILKKYLEKYIHGIEIQANEVKECILNLNSKAKKFKIYGVKWDIITSDTLIVDSFDNKMDFVVGNPPYVRVHNLAASYQDVKNFYFAQNGMTDLYLVFFEIGLRMLKKTGKMCLITPSSCLTSNAGINFREYIFKNRNLTKIVDLGHHQVFDAMTYTMITLFNKSKKVDYLEYYIYDVDNKKPKKYDTLDYTDIFINGKMYIGNKDSLLLLHNLENYNKDVKNDIYVKNGFATLADDIFIGNFKTNNLVIDVLKASTGRWYKCIFPYSKEGVPLEISHIKNNPKIYKHLLDNRSKLSERSIDKSSNWFLFGRSQAIKDVYKDKIAINTIIRDIDSIKIEEVPAGKGVYSGLYILTDFSIEIIKNVLISHEFINYLKLLKKYKSGGYYTFSSNELRKFLTYKIREKNYEQSTIFEITS